MKNIVLIGMFALFATGACNKSMQYSQVPEDVIISFNQRYPDATDTKWKEDGGLYEVRFKDGDTKKEATYSADGSLLDIEEKM